MNEPGRIGIGFNLYLITDRKNTRGRELAHVVEEALAGGVKGVQLREKDLSGRDLYVTACELRELTARYGARLLINDRLDIALAADADGVHLGERSIPVREARRILGPARLIGVSCHDRAGALSAQEAGADFITFGPVFYTPSKAIYGEPVGVGKLREIAPLMRIPVFALGGITRDNTPLTVSAGAHGIALISAVMAADNPREEAKALLSLLPAAPRED